MPNITFRPPVGADDIDDFMNEVSAQVRNQTGRGFQWNFDPVNMVLHYEEEEATDKVIQDADKKVHRMYGNKISVGTLGAFSIPRGKLKKALVIFMEQRGKKVKFKSWL